MTLAEIAIDLHMQSKVAGAAFDLLGYLTTRDQDIPIGAHSDCNPALNRLQQWAIKRGLELKDADVEHWDESDIPPPWSERSRTRPKKSNQILVRPVFQGP